MSMMFCCGSALEAQRAGTRAAATKAKKNQAARFHARDVRQLLRGGGMEEGSRRGMRVKASRIRSSVRLHRAALRRVIAPPAVRLCIVFPVIFHIFYSAAVRSLVDQLQRQPLSSLRGLSPA